MGAAPVVATGRVAQARRQSSGASTTGPALRGREVPLASQALPSVSYGVACGSTECAYGASLSDVYPAPLTWSTTPSLFGVPTGGYVGWGSAQLQKGIVTVGAITDGVADEGVEDWLQAVYDAPNPTGTGAAWDSLSVHAHIYTVVLSNNFGLLSNVSASYLKFILQSQGVQEDQDVSISTGVTVGPPDFEDMETLEQFLDFASAQMQNAATSAISVAAGQASPEAAFSNYLSSAFTGGAVYQTDLTLSASAYVSGQGPQPVDVQLSPELVVANAGLGITGTYAVSLVQLTVSGTAQPAGTPTSLSLGLYGPGGQALPAGSHGLPETSFGQPLKLEATVHGPSGEVIGLSGPKVSFEVPTVDVSGPFSCTLQDGSCTATVPASSPMPVGFQSVTARWAGTGGSGYAGSSASQLVDVAPGQSVLRLVGPSPALGGADAMAGQPYTLRVYVGGANGMNFLWLAKGGTVTLFDDGSPVGTCTPAELPESSGDGCDITWVPSLGPDVATRSADLEATWTGNQVYQGAAGELRTSLVVAHPGVGLFLTAAPPALGYSWARSCSTDKLGVTICKPKLVLTTSGTVTAEVLLNGYPVRGASVEVTSKGPASLSAQTCTTGADGSCTLGVKVPASKSTVVSELSGVATSVPDEPGSWSQGYDLLDVGLYGSQPPSVTAVSPSSGPVGGGSSVQVSGNGLWGASKVTFGGVPAPSFAVQADGSVLAVAPRGEGTCNVQVTTALGTSAATSADLYSFGSAHGPSEGGSAVVLPGDLNGLLGLPSGEAWASLSPPGTGSAPVSGGRVVALSTKGVTVRSYPAPYTTGLMALYGPELYYLARTGTGYTNWQTTLVQLSAASGESKRFSYTAAPVGPGGVAVGAGGAPLYLGVSEIGGPYGVPVVLELNPRTGGWAARRVPSSQGGGVGGLASGADGGTWGIVPKSSEVFWLSSPGASFRTFSAPGTTTPVSLDGITAVGTSAYATVSGAAPGTVGIFAVDSANGATTWLPAPAYVASVSGPTWDDGLWVGAVTSKGEAGALGYRAGAWHFVPVYARASYSTKLLVAPAGPGELWFGQAGGDRLWELKVAPGTSGPVPLASGHALPTHVPVRKSDK
ncbi:MAG: IPT/TIG domain-containing protein [Acidimicrobiales bacterium]